MKNKQFKSHLHERKQAQRRPVTFKETLNYRVAEYKHKVSVGISKDHIFPTYVVFENIKTLVSFICTEMRIATLNQFTD